MVGLPGHGKTTFLAALWHVVEAPGVDARLRLVSLSGDRAYLNEISETWLRCEPMPHTPTEALEEVALVLRSEVGDVELRVPDLSGETFQSHWVDRHWNRSYAQLVENADGIVLFIHALDYHPTATLDAVQELNAAAGLGVETSGDSSTASEFDARSSPDQVQLVDLLQLHLAARSEKPIPIAVLVSAWDQVPKNGPEPGAWLTRNLPLLAQFLDTNSECVPSRVYGVSAQGGPLPQMRDVLLGQDPAERIEVRGHSADAHDITHPLEWLAFGED